MNKNKLNYLDEPMKVIGKVDPKLKARIDRVQAVIQILTDRYESIPKDVWDAITRKLYELVKMV